MMRSLSTSENVRVRQLFIEVRERLGLTQAEVAARLGKLQSYVSKYERGVRRLDIGEVLRIAKALNIDAHFLIDEIRGLHRESEHEDNGLGGTGDEKEQDYIAEFKREAVRLLDKSGKSPDRFERDLGIRPGCLERWKQELAELDEKDSPAEHGQLTPE
jgi:transcriptional regulator with XRE-family HTH domain